MKNELLTIQNLSVTTTTGETRKSILSGVNVSVEEEDVVALVGGSGSGKTTTGLAVLRLLSPGLAISAGEIIFENKNILTHTEAEMRTIRGGKIGMVFQEPLTAFNPVFRLGEQVEEVLCVHTGLTGAQRRERIRELFRLTGLPDPRRVAESYPHQLSGGMRQRAMIAQAIAADPKLLIADEPTSSLDVTLQAKVMELFRDLRKQLKLSVLLITHDLGVVQHLADKVVVMSDGHVVETGATATVLQNPATAYTKQLMAVL